MINNKEAQFITFEGGEGCGKSTQSKMLYEYLISKNIRVILTREVGGTTEAEKIRAILLHSHLLPMSELMLVMAARCEHLNKLIIPALKNGTWVICDRFIDSTAVYQGQFPEIGMDKVYELHETIISKIMPSLTFFIDVAPDIALKRAISRGDSNKFEDKEMAFHQKVYKGFQKVSRKFKDRIIRVESSTLTKDEIHKKIISYL